MNIGRIYNDALTPGPLQTATAPALGGTVLLLSRQRMLSDLFARQLRLELPALRVIEAADPAEIDVLMGELIDLVVLIAAGDAPARLRDTLAGLDRTLCPAVTLVITDCADLALPDAADGDPGRHVVLSMAASADALPSALQRLIRRQAGRDRGTDAAAPVDPTAGLSGREQQVLGFLRRGHSNKDIARSLDLSEGTVKAHLRNIMRKVGVRNRVELAMAGGGAMHGLVAAPPPPPPPS
ncbi:response regulator transcription factor, partial [Acidisphaera rubrifaciens]|uniref:response regulator transcription factor n=1 Tax=Acidisphaera rubrifaciens TaxID=50715 RepID=UPI000662B41A